MKRLPVFCFVLWLGVLFISFISLWADNRVGIANEKVPVQALSTVNRPGLAVNPNFGKVPLYFIPNKGQVNEKAKFYAKTSRYTLWMTEEALVFDSVKKVEVKAEVEATHPAPAGHPRRGPYKASQEGDTPRPLRVHPSQEGIIDRDVSRLVFLNANKNPGIVPLEITQHKVNYYIGSDPGKWQKGISTSKLVLYKDLYKNIDLKVYGNESQIEYDWIVKPGGNPGSIRFEYKNVKGTGIDKNGNLLIETKFGELIHKKPVSYQLLDGEKVEIESGYIEIEKNTYGFKVETYNQNDELIIDPVVSLDYSTYLGGSDYENVNGIAIDDTGNIYLCGRTDSSDFPVTNSNVKNIELTEIFITGLKPDGSGLIFSTYFGGNAGEVPYDMVLAKSGYLYITGVTRSNDFPMSTASQYKGEDDVFFCRLDTSGSLLCSWYIGGTYTDVGRGIAVDDSDNAYIVGNTYSNDFPTLNAFQDSVFGYGGSAFVCKIHYDAGLIYSTFLGGEYDEHGQDIAVDDTGSCYVTGYTWSAQFPVKNAFQGTYRGGRDGFLCKFKPDGSDLVYSTFLGGKSEDDAVNLTVDKNGSVYITGLTTSNNFPVKNAYQDKLIGAGDAFISKFNPGGTGLIFSTYLGGTDDDSYAMDNREGGYGIALEESGCVYISGITSSVDFPIKNAFQDKLKGEIDFFLCKLSKDGNEIINSTYLGGSAVESPGSVTLDKQGNVYIIGDTYSYDFPTQNPYQDYKA
ncbi:SBBP repeat-containing protein, partial [Acidobacteriota bacterium]